MGDHVCSSREGTKHIRLSVFKSRPLMRDEATPPPDSHGSFDRMPYKQKPTNGPGELKPSRMMPPRVDTSAASTSTILQRFFLY